MMVQLSSTSHPIPQRPREPQSTTRRATTSLAWGYFPFSTLSISVNGLLQPCPRKCSQDPSAHFAKWKQICSQAARRAKNSCWSLGCTRWAVMGFEHPELSRRTARGSALLALESSPSSMENEQGLEGLRPWAGRGAPADCAGPCMMGTITMPTLGVSVSSGLDPGEVFVGFWLPERRHTVRKSGRK